VDFDGDGHMDDALFNSRTRLRTIRAGLISNCVNVHD